MRLPNADKAIIAPEKLRDYLLNPSHRRGSVKARMLLACGYRSETWAILERDLRTQHLADDVQIVRETPFGQRFEIHAPLETPKGRKVIFRSIWQIDHGTEVASIEYNVSEVTYGI